MLLSMIVIVVEVVPLVFQGIERLIFNFPPCSPPSHQLVDVVLRHSKVRYPAEMLDFVLAHLPVLNEIHSHVGARLIEWHVIDKAKLMCNACGAVMPLIRGKAWRRNNVLFHSACMLAPVPEHFLSSIPPCLKHVAV